MVEMETTDDVNHLRAIPRRKREDRQPSIKDINELYSALQELVKLPPGRSTKSIEEESTVFSQSSSNEVEKVAVKNCRIKVSRTVSSPATQPLYKKNGYEIPNDTLREMDTLQSGQNGEVFGAVKKPSPSTMKRCGKVTPLEEEAENENESDQTESTKPVEASEHTIVTRARSRSSPGISKVAALKKLKEKHKKITETFSRKEKVSQEPPVIRSIDDLMELAKQPVSLKTKASLFNVKQQKKAVGSRERMRRRSCDSVLSPYDVSLRLNNWYQKAVARALDDGEIVEDGNDSSVDISTGTRKASNVSLNSLTSFSSLNSYNSGCTDLSTTEDHDMLSTECRRFTEQLKSLDMGDEEEYDSDTDSGVNVKPTLILVRERGSLSKQRLPKNFSDSRLTSTYKADEVKQNKSNSKSKVVASTSESLTRKPFFYIPNLTDDQKTNFTVVVNYDEKEENNSTEDQPHKTAEKSKIGLAQDSNFYHLTSSSNVVAHRSLPSSRERPRSYDIAESGFDFANLVTVADENGTNNHRQVGRTQSMQVGKGFERNISVDSNENITGVSEKKWWGIFKSKPQRDLSTGKKKLAAKRKSSFKRL